MSAQLQLLRIIVGVNSLVRRVDILMVRRFESALCEHVNAINVAKHAASSRRERGPSEMDVSIADAPIVNTLG